MADDNGWIKLHRKLLENPIMLNAELLQLFIYCLLKANHKDRTIIWNGVEKLVKIGSFISGLHAICESLNQKQTSTYRRLQTLEELGYISIKAENRFSVITVLKYSSYQILIDAIGKPVENKRKTDGKQTETDNNDNNEKNDKNKVNIPFDIFWNAYDKKKGDKEKLTKKWHLLTDLDRKAIMEYIPKYKESQPDKQYRKDPQTFLNNKSWNDELIYKNGKPAERKTITLS